MNVLILGAGQPDPDWVLERLARRADWVIAADGGVELARERGIAVQQAVGDGDSLGAAGRRWLAETGVPFDRHPADKDQTDLELAFELALGRRPARVDLCGAWGRRADHALSNVGLLERAARAGVAAALWAGCERLHVRLPGEHRLTDCARGQRLSLLPLSASVGGVRTAGLRFPLRGETLRRTAGRGVSNVVERPPVTLAFARGVLLVLQAFSEDAWAA